MRLRDVRVSEKVNQENERNLSKKTGSTLLSVRYRTVGQRVSKLSLWVGPPGHSVTQSRVIISHFTLFARYLLLCTTYLPNLLIG
jgi:hypothetical protein